MEGKDDVCKWRAVTATFTKRQEKEGEEKGRGTVIEHIFTLVSV